VSAHDETFLAIKNAGERGETKTELEAAFIPDIYGEIDERNGWHEGDESPSEDDQLIQLAAKGWRDFFLFCFHDVVLDEDDETGAGLQLAVLRFISVAHFIAGDVLRSKVTSYGPRGRKIETLVPLTLAQLAALPQIHSTPKRLQQLALEFAEEWGVEFLIEKCRKPLK
jgi:hypothetical protein